MSEPTCVDLLERYGSEFKVGFDPCYDARGVPLSNLDPHYMRLECEKGIIFVHDDSRRRAKRESEKLNEKQLG